MPTLRLILSTYLLPIVSPLIAIAFLSRGSILGVVFTSLFFGALRSGANVMQRSADVPVTIVNAIQKLTVLFIAISLALEYKTVRRLRAPLPLL